MLPSSLAYRECTKDGTWFLHPDSNKTWSNYTTCVDFEDLEKTGGQKRKLPLGRQKTCSWCNGSGGRRRKGKNLKQEN
ncbi:hypothetical protein J437_LFUL012118 [Ladona fulva]|uniref:G-protein coupled receptors family 2 profile 1 domain-containing protein n=1 Tax=Ladona fulva TaxID=123851 RepID=A0A8K0P3C5_LADFU|nr:hypothetical protein J437_LFUL012118 [Ladona fulva]